MARQRHERQLRMRLMDLRLKVRRHESVDLTNFRQDAKRLDAETVRANIFVACRLQQLGLGGLNTLLARGWPSRRRASWSHLRPPGCGRSSRPMGMSMAITAGFGDSERIS